MSSLKAHVHTACQLLLVDKIRELRSELDDLQEGAENDAKSSAGDKHETARAMMQTEHARIGQLLSETIHQKNTLDQLDPLQHASSVVPGSLIKTQRGWFYLSIPIGKTSVDDTLVTALSPLSPLGSQLMNKRTGETAEVNGTKYIIEEIQ